VCITIQVPKVLDSYTGYSGGHGRENMAIIVARVMNLKSYFNNLVVIYLISDSERSYECIDFTVMCVLFYFLCPSSTFGAVKMLVKCS